MDFVLNFEPHQIVCLEHQGLCLYAEVIQVVAIRQVCWVRPLILVVSVSNSHAEGKGEFQEASELCPLWDLREGADLLWPVSLFRPALDTEVLPLLTQLQLLDESAKDSIKAHLQLKNFVAQVWEAYPDAFVSG